MAEVHKSLNSSYLKYLPSSPGPFSGPFARESSFTAFTAEVHKPLNGSYLKYLLSSPGPFSGPFALTLTPAPRPEVLPLPPGGKQSLRSDFDSSFIYQTLRQ